MVSMFHLNLLTHLRHKVMGYSFYDPHQQSKIQDTVHKHPLLSKSTFQHIMANSKFFGPHHLSDNLGIDRNTPMAK